MSKSDPALRLPPQNQGYQIFNSHCHLNDDQEFSQAEALIKECHDFNVTDLIVVGSDQVMNDRAWELSQKYAHCYCAVGWHPEFWSQYQDSKLLPFLNKPQPAQIIGEIGLDYHYTADDHYEQQRVFKDQLTLAQQYDLPVAIHTRDAFADTLQIIKEQRICRGVIHNFNQGPQQAAAYLDQGMMLSISGVVTFKNAAKLRDSLRIIPRDRLLVETDDPYLTPVPFRGHPNRPAYVYFTLKYLADLLAEEIGELAKQTMRNTKWLLNGES